jgi:hypothetical protein
LERNSSSSFQKKAFEVDEIIKSHSNDLKLEENFPSVKLIKSNRPVEPGNPQKIPYNKFRETKTYSSQKVTITIKLFSSISINPVNCFGKNNPEKHAKITTKKIK